MSLRIMGRIIVSCGSIVAIALMVGACSGQTGAGTTTTKFPKFDQKLYDAADSMAGGMFYDTWWETGESPPGNSNPLITATGSSNEKNGETWRCEYCHGWDYNGSSGAGKPVAPSLAGLPKDDPKMVFEFIVNGTTGSKKSHKFWFGATSTTRIYDLTKFLLTENLSVDQTGNGNRDLGKSYYTTHAYKESGRRGCEGSTCHGSATNKAILLKGVSNPAEFIHKVRFGNANTVMPGGPSLSDAKDILAYVKTLSADTPTTPDPSTFDNARYIDTTKQLADLIQGGLLYDKWWLSTNQSGAAPPTANHPLWPTNANPKVSVSTTWRCKQCHGWDYRGAEGAYKSGTNFSGIKGIIPTNAAPLKFLTAKEVFTFVKSGTNHAFGAKLSNTDIYGLTRFVMTQRDLNKASKATFSFIDDISRGTIGTSISKGGTLYSTGTISNCATSSCHGTDGMNIDFTDGKIETTPNVFLDTLAKINPWETIHKALYGHSGSTMPALVVSVSMPGLAATVTDAADILAYAQTSLVPNVMRGALLYDKWWAENGAPKPTTDQALWASRSKTLVAGVFDNARSGADSWRCKECHGWDYKGKDGAFGMIGNNHKTDFPGILTRIKTTTPDSIGTFIRAGTNHVFGGAALLSERDIKDLVAFITDSTNGLTDVTTALTGGNTTNGKALYDGTTPGNCKACHGELGVTVPTVDIAFEAEKNPTEFIHKSRFGSAGSTMVPTPDKFTGLTLSQASDVRAHALGLAGVGAVKLDRGGRLFDKWWAEMAVTDPSMMEPMVVNPMWATRNAAVPDIAVGKPISRTWRCINCHEWNYRGVGFTRSVKGTVTSNDNLVSLRARYSLVYTEEQFLLYIFDRIKNGKGGTHNFGVAQAGLSKPLADADIWDLTKFLVDGVVDTTAYLSNLGSIVTADPAASILAGGGLYNGATDPAAVNCSSCHGADGVTSPPRTTAQLDILDVAKNEATEFFHKVRFGQPGTNMPAMLGVVGITDLITANIKARDVLGYSQDVYCKRLPKPTGC